jgi:hypothetical protein
MYIKPQSVIPAGTKITKVPASEGKGKNVYTLARAHERKLERQEALKQKADAVAQLIRNGFTVMEAIKAVGK